MFMEFSRFPANKMYLNEPNSSIICYMYTCVQRQKAVSAYFTSKQILPLQISIVVVFIYNADYKIYTLFFSISTEVPNPTNQFEVVNFVIMNMNNEINMNTLPTLYYKDSLIRLDIHRANAMYI